jgi:zinc transporter ZupT
MTGANQAVAAASERSPGSSDLQQGPCCPRPRGLPGPILAALIALGAGAMLYLTVTDLISEGAERHYQQSAALANGVGFLAVLILSHLV